MGCRCRRRQGPGADQKRVSFASGSWLSRKASSRLAVSTPGQHTADQTRRAVSQREGQQPGGGDQHQPEAADMDQHRHPDVRGTAQGAGQHALQTVRDHHQRHQVQGLDRQHLHRNCVGVDRRDDAAAQGDHRRQHDHHREGDHDAKPARRPRLPGIARTDPGSDADRGRRGEPHRGHEHHGRDVDRDLIGRKRGGAQPPADQRQALEGAGLEALRDRERQPEAQQLGLQPPAQARPSSGPELPQRWRQQHVADEQRQHHPAGDRRGEGGPDSPGGQRIPEP